MPCILSRAHLPPQFPSAWSALPRPGGLPKARLYVSHFSVKIAQGDHSQAERDSSVVRDEGHVIQRCQELTLDSEASVVQVGIACVAGHGFRVLWLLRPQQWPPRGTGSGHPRISVGLPEGTHSLMF